MSYILEALKKAEQQRELGRVPGIASDHDPKSAGRRRWRLWVLILAVNAAGLATLFWYDRQPDRSPRVVAEATTDVPATETPRPPMIQPIVEPAEAPQPLPRQSPMTTNDPVTVDVPEEPALRSMHEPPPQRPPPVAPAQSVQLPVWPQIPGTIFEQLNSSLHLDVHVYSDQPQDRFVLLNLRKYHEGDDLQEGPRLDEITPEGVILSFRGERFRVQRQ